MVFQNYFTYFELYVGQNQKITMEKKEVANDNRLSIAKTTTDHLHLPYIYIYTRAIFPAFPPSDFAQ